MKHLCAVSLCAVLVWFAAPLSALAQPAVPMAVHMANGIKIGEVDQTSAIVWTRLTRHPERNTQGRQFTEQDGEPGKGLYDLDPYEGSVPGASGEVRVRVWPEHNPRQVTTTEWQPVEPDRDFTRQIKLTGFEPDTKYRLAVEGRGDAADQSPTTTEGGFRTAPAPDDPAAINFVVVTCGDYPRRDDPDRGHRIYPVMRELDPHFFVHTGDIEYYDKPFPYATTAAAARFKWNRVYAMPFQRDFHRHVASYFMKDDHDTLKNDCWPGQTYGDLTWDEGLAIFREQVPMGEKTYRTVRWGKDLQIWMVEGRDFRDPNTDPDGPDKTIWGAEQKQWFYDTVAASDATFRILMSPTPMVGPDKPRKNDSHANPAFAHEGRELRKFIAEQDNMFFICGDRHWQYVSVDPESGMREYACGASSNAHAGGFTEDQRSDWHQYLRIKGGFMSVAVDRQGGTPHITLRHHGVGGRVHHEDIFPATQRTLTPGQGTGEK